MSRILEAIRQLAAAEPVLIRNVILALVALLTAGGLAVSQELVEAGIAFVFAVLTLFTALDGRQKVTPVDRTADFAKEVARHVAVREVRAEINRHRGVNENATHKEREV